LQICVAIKPGTPLVPPCHHTYTHTRLIVAPGKLARPLLPTNAHHPTRSSVGLRKVLFKIPPGAFCLFASLAAVWWPALDSWGRMEIGEAFGSATAQL